MNTRVLVRTIDEALAGRGFVRKGMAWFRDTGECVGVIELENSRWGGQYLIGLGVTARTVLPEAFPRQEQYHIVTVVSSHVLPEDAALLRKSLDLEDTSVPADQRVACLSWAIRDHALPFLDSLSTLEAIRKAFDQGRLRRSGIRRELLELLRGSN